MDFIYFYSFKLPTWFVDIRWFESRSSKMYFRHASHKLRQPLNFIWPRGPIWNVKQLLADFVDVLTKLLTLTYRRCPDTLGTRKWQMLSTVWRFWHLLVAPHGWWEVLVLQCIKMVRGTSSVWPNNSRMPMKSRNWRALLLLPSDSFLHSPVYRIIRRFKAYVMFWKAFWPFLIFLLAVSRLPSSSL